MITEAQIKTLCPSPKIDIPKLVAALNAACEKYEINTARRRRYFVAQTMFETLSYLKFAEDMYYVTPEQLCKVWSTRFSMIQEPKKAFAPDYVRNDKKLGNFIYAGRNGNGNQDSGDGYNFRGGGPIHLTGRANYAAASMAIYGDDRFITNPDLVREYGDGFLSAGWYWSVNGLNELADQDSFTKVTKIINGSEQTVKERLPVLNKVNLVIE